MGRWRDMCDFMATPCKDCPFRTDKKPFLTPERGEELAYAASNPYNSFPCHKTTESDDDSDEGNRIYVSTTKECAGFLTLMAQELGEDAVYHDGFKPSYNLVYESSCDMTDAYADIEVWAEYYS